MEQSAVSFVINKLNPLINQMPNVIFSTICNILIEAKAMEKEQIENSYLAGLFHSLEMGAAKQAEEYYNEKYN